MAISFEDLPLFLGYDLMSLLHVAWVLEKILFFILLFSPIAYGI